MKSRFAAVLITFLGIALTLAAVLSMVAASTRISAIVNPTWRSAMVGMEIVGGVMWLLGTVYAATRVAVFLFGRSAGNHPRGDIQDTRTAARGGR